MYRTRYDAQLIPCGSSLLDPNLWRSGGHNFAPFCCTNANSHIPGYSFINESTRQQQGPLVNIYRASRVTHFRTTFYTQYL